MSSVENELTLDKTLEKLDNDGLQVIAKNLRLACSYLHKICADNTTTHIKFINLRNKMLKYALVYRKEIFPLIKEMVSELQDMMENYSVLTFEEFLDEISFLVENARIKKKI